jgi:hypothetical protein
VKFDPRFCKRNSEGGIPCRIGGEIAGERAHLYRWGRGMVAFCGVGTKLRRKLLSIPGVMPWQTGDEEFSVRFPDSASQVVAKVVKPVRLAGAALEAVKAKFARKATTPALETAFSF